MFEPCRSCSHLLNFAIATFSTVALLAFFTFFYKDGRVNRRATETANKHWWTIVGVFAFIALYVIAGSIE